MDTKEQEKIPRKLDILEAEFGPELTLVDEGGADSESRYQILRELDLAGRHYVVLRPPDSRDADAAVYRVTESEAGRHIEHVEDEIEWEEVADAIDELLINDES
ncbi:DUF1292 domain-containing protein [Salinithrix halophila]